MCMGVIFICSSDGVERIFLVRVDRTAQAMILGTIYNLITSFICKLGRDEIWGRWRSSQLVWGDDRALFALSWKGVEENGKLDQTLNTMLLVINFFDFLWNR